MKQDRFDTALGIGIVLAITACVIPFVMSILQRIKHNEDWHTIKTERARDTNKARSQATAKGDRYTDRRTRRDVHVHVTKEN